MEIKNSVEIVQESFSAFDCEHYHCLLNETKVLPEFRNKKWVSVDDVLKDIKTIDKWHSTHRTRNLIKILEDAIYEKK